jgi:hypothetical protein
MATAVLRELFDVRAMDDFPGPFARRARQTVAELRALWELTSREAARNRRLADLHAARDDYRELLEAHLGLLKEYAAVAALHRRAFGPAAGWDDELSRAAADLAALHAELFPRWQSEADLQQLLIEKFTLAPDALRARAAAHPPPASWLDETADPFAD